MTETKQDIKKAVADIAQIRRSLGRVDLNQSHEIDHQQTYGAHIIMQATALILAAIGIIMELTSQHHNSAMFLESAGNPTLQAVGLVQIALIIAVLTGAIYALVYRTARNTNREFGKYISRHFSYLKNLSFLSDLVVKFSIIAILILAEKPELVAPVCLLFVGDYLIQGRFFTVQLELSLLMGAIFMIGAVAMFHLGSSLLIWPFTAVAVAAACSLIQMIALRKEAGKLHHNIEA